MFAKRISQRKEIKMKFTTDVLNTESAHTEVIRWENPFVIDG